MSESVENYTKRVRTCVIECYPKFAKANRDHLMRDCRVMGLHHELKIAVLNQQTSKLEDVIGAALLAESVKATLEDGRRYRKPETHFQQPKPAEDRLHVKNTAEYCRRIP